MIKHYDPSPVQLWLLKKMYEGADVRRYDGDGNYLVRIVGEPNRILFHDVNITQLAHRRLVREVKGDRLKITRPGKAVVESHPAVDQVPREP